jgi:antitoxin HigA-1
MKKLVSIPAADAPLHPGTIVRRELLDPRDLTVGAAAALLGIGRCALSNFLNGNSNLTGDMALRLEKAFGRPMETSMHDQYQYDLYHIRARAHTITGVRAYRPAGRRTGTGRRDSSADAVL